MILKHGIDIKNDNAFIMKSNLIMVFHLHLIFKFVV